MQTRFTAAQRQHPGIAEAESILRKCVHCGFCTATCPTYVELGNELDSPRGRIYLIKEMLENDRPANAGVARHIDRCLSCLACMTTCPSGVDYMHLIDIGGAHVEATGRRPPGDRLLRAVLASVLPYPRRFRAALLAAFFAKPLAPAFQALGGPFQSLAAMIRLAPTRFSRGDAAGRPQPATPPGRGAERVAILTGCAQPVLEPGINAAAMRLLARMGVAIVIPQGEGCCGALVHHMGRKEAAKAHARANVDAWMREVDGQGLDAILITASGCGTTIKDYGHLLAGDPDYAAKAAHVAGLACDITEYLSAAGLPDPVRATGQSVAYHAACSLQHGQRVVTQPKILLEKAGFAVRDIAEGHLCCGSAGTYNILQPEIAGRLRERKLANIHATAADFVATGNIGCMAQLAAGTGIPVVHTVQLLDWATGGPDPASFA